MASRWVRAPLAQEHNNLTLVNYRISNLQQNNSMLTVQT